MCGAPLTLSRVQCIQGSAAMPTALRNGPYRFYFYSYDCNERRHMHVDRERRTAKFWIDPDVMLAENSGYRANELRQIERIIRDNLEELRHAWDAFCIGDSFDTQGGRPDGDQ